MKLKDFEIIIIRSVFEISTISFLESERIKFGCLPFEYIRCLKRAFIDLHSETNCTDEEKFRITMPDGKIFDDKFDPDFCRENQVENFSQYGEISYPYKKHIDLSLKTNGLISGELTSEALFNYLPYFKEYFSWLKSKFPEEFEFSKSNLNKTDQLFDKLFNEDLIDMPDELKDHWEKLKHSSITELSHNISDFDKIFNETEYLMSQCKKYNDDLFRTRELFLKYRNLDNSDKYTLIDGIRVRSPQRLMLTWIYQLTNLDLATYEYAHSYVAEILTEDDFIIYEIKDYKRPKRSDSSFSTENSSQISLETVSSNLKNEEKEKLERIKRYIEEKIETLDQKGWKYSFGEEIERDKFINVFSYFFAGLSYKLPDEIKLKKGSKTRFSPIIGQIYNHFQQTALIKNDNFLKIVKIIDQFNRLETNRLIKRIQSEKERD